MSNSSNPRSIPMEVFAMLSGVVCTFVGLYLLGGGVVQLYFTITGSVLLGAGEITRNLFMGCVFMAVGMIFDHASKYPNR